MEQFELKRPVFLVGFNGAGKTTLARRLARRCGLAAADVDHGIEREYGMRIPDLFSAIGEDAFRQLEAAMLERYLASPPMIISCGGGIVCLEKSRRIIADGGFVIHMVVSPEESSARISSHSTRPYFGSMESIRQTNRQRMPYYFEIADASVDVSGMNVDRLVGEVQEILVKEGVLCPLQK